MSDSFFSDDAGDSNRNESLGRIEKNWQGKVAAVKSTFVTRVQTCLIVYHKGMATKRVRETSVVTAIKLYSFLTIHFKQGNLMTRLSEV